MASVRRRDEHSSAVRQSPSGARPSAGGTCADRGVHARSRWVRHHASLRLSFWRRIDSERPRLAFHRLQRLRAPRHGWAHELRTINRPAHLGLRHAGRGGERCRSNPYLVLSVLLRHEQRERRLASDHADLDGVRPRPPRSRRSSPNGDPGARERVAGLRASTGYQGHRLLPDRLYAPRLWLSALVQALCNDDRAPLQEQPNDRLLATRQRAPQLHPWALLRSVRARAFCARSPTT